MIVILPGKKHFKHEGEANHLLTFDFGSYISHQCGCQLASLLVLLSLPMEVKISFLGIVFCPCEERMRVLEGVEHQQYL